jgi:hypothetical protein
MIATRAINSPLELEIPNLIDPLFKMTIDTTKVGVTNNQSFILPLQNGVTNVTVNWGDGTSNLITAYNQAELLHGYSSSGTYQITLDGSFSGIRFANGGDKLKLSSIDNWGNNQWVNLASAFHGCTNMVANYIDNPDTSSVTDMSRMFFGCTNFNGAVEFDTSNVTNLFYMMYNCSTFNQPINWNTSNVNSSQSFGHTFDGCTVLNSSFNLTDTSNAKGFSFMFYRCISFNQPINFNVTSGTNLGGMFHTCDVFNQEITFNAPVCTSISSILQGSHAFNQPINITSSSLLTNCSRMMVTCSAFNSSITISDTSGVTNMTSMFQQCTVFDQDISSLQINALTTASNMMLLSGFSITNYDLLLPAWDAYATSNVPFHAGNAQYGAGAPTTAHDAMVVRGWTITDGGTP